MSRRFWSSWPAFTRSNSLSSIFKPAHPSLLFSQRIISTPEMQSPAYSQLPPFRQCALWRGLSAHGIFHAFVCEAGLGGTSQLLFPSCSVAAGFCTRSHLLIKLVFAAPASFFSAA